MIGSGEIVEDHGPAGVVQLGSTVTLAERHQKETFTIVGSAEADALKGRLSEDSPLGRSLLRHHAGDTVQWDSPAGVYRARIVRIA
jgi:transcription elongation factor GreA